MKKLIIAGLAALVSACAAAPEKTYPYGMNEKEWNELSIQDKHSQPKTIRFEMGERTL